MLSGGVSMKMKTRMNGLLRFLKSGLQAEGKNRRQKVLIFAVVFVIMTLAGVFLGVMSLYFSAGLYSKDLLGYYLCQPRLVLLNTLPYLLLCYFVWVLSNRPWIGFLVGGIVALMYSFAEYWKLLSRDDPVYAADLLVLKEALQMSGDYVAVTPVMILSVCLVICGVIVFALLFWRSKILGALTRVVLMVGIVIGCSVLYSTTYTSAEVYDAFKVWEPLNQWFDNNQYISRGGIYPFIYSIQSAVPQKPEGYDENRAEQMLAEYKTDAIPEELKANVIFVMLEAFSDLSEETDFITEADPYAAYHHLKNESYSGKLMTNVFAGGTINTERSVLTGFSELVNFRRQSWSYVRYFADQGYCTTGSHGGYRAFYSREIVNKNLGFENYYFIENY